MSHAPLGQDGAELDAPAEEAQSPMISRLDVPGPPDLNKRRSDIVRRMCVVAVGWLLGCLVVLLLIECHHDYLSRGPATHTLQWTFASFLTGICAGPRLNFYYFGAEARYYFPDYDVWFWLCLLWALGVAALYIHRGKPWTRFVFWTEVILRSGAAAFSILLEAGASV